MQVPHVASCLPNRTRLVSTRKKEQRKKPRQQILSKKKTQKGGVANIFTNNDRVQRHAPSGVGMQYSMAGACCALGLGAKRLGNGLQTMQKNSLCNASQPEAPSNDSTNECRCGAKSGSARCRLPKAMPFKMSKRMYLAGKRPSFYREPGQITHSARVKSQVNPNMS